MSFSQVAMLRQWTVSYTVVVFKLMHIKPNSETIFMGSLLIVFIVP